MLLIKCNLFNCFKFNHNHYPGFANKVTSEYMLQTWHKISPILPEYGPYLCMAPQKCYKGPT